MIGLYLYEDMPTAKVSYGESQKTLRIANSSTGGNSNHWDDIKLLYTWEFSDEMKIIYFALGTGWTTWHCIYTWALKLKYLLNTRFNKRLFTWSYFCLGLIIVNVASTQPLHTFIVNVASCNARMRRTSVFTKLLGGLVRFCQSWKYSFYFTT